MDLEEIYQSKFIIIEVDVGKKLLLTTWTEETQILEDKIYREEVLNYVEYLKKYQPKFLLNDIRLFMMPLVPETQEWLAELISEILNQYVEKYAIITPEEFIPQLAVDQAVDEVKKLGNATIFKHFDSIDEAMDWLFKKQD